jgi:hypothetical protein
VVARSRSPRCVQLIHYYPNPPLTTYGLCGSRGLHLRTPSPRSPEAPTTGFIFRRGDWRHVQIDRHVSVTSASSHPFVSCACGVIRWGVCVLCVRAPLTRLLTPPRAFLWPRVNVAVSSHFCSSPFMSVRQWDGSVEDMALIEVVTSRWRPW